MVSAKENQIVLEFDNLAQAFQLLKPWSGRKQRAEFTEHIHQSLLAAGLSLEIKVKGFTVAHLGMGEMSGSLLRLIEEPA